MKLQSPASALAHTRATEKLHHFSCTTGKKWWSIGDAPTAKKIWYCPWCGTKATYKTKN